MSSELCLVLNGLDCPSCAGKIEDKVQKAGGIQSATMNFMNKEMKITYEDIEKEEVITKVREITRALEPDVCVNEKKKEEREKVEPEQGYWMNKELITLIPGSILYAAALLAPLEGVLEQAVFLAAYLLLGGSVLISALKSISRGSLFNENFLMSIATIGALYLGDYPEAVAVMLFYRVGELLQEMAVDNSRKSISKLMDIKPEFANVLTQGVPVVTDPADVKIGDLIVVKPGERVPLDGVVLEGNSFVDSAALTGESVPQSVKVGDEVLSGVINQTGLLKMKVTKDYSNSTVFRILELAENAASKKAPTEKLITSFSRIYTPVVVFAAIALAIIPPLVIPGAVFQDWLNRAMVFLVISCPCALVISVPLGFFSGIGHASQIGILIKGGNYLQALSQIDTVVFDKTGTLTAGEFSVTDILPGSGQDKALLLQTAYVMESLSNHPIAKSIAKACISENARALLRVSDFEELAGRGLRGRIEGREALCGSKKLMEERGIDYKEFDSLGTPTYVALGGKYLGAFVISDRIREDSRETISALRQNGVKEIVMLTGDREETALRVGESLGIDKVHAGLLPNEKVERLEEFIGKGRKVAFVGDGINDAPVLARADVGIAMGGVGSDAAIEAADVVIMNDRLGKISQAISIARNTMSIVKQNIVFSLAVKLVVLTLGVFGHASMWLAVLADVGVTLLVVLNAMRKKG